MNTEMQPAISRSTANLLRYFIPGLVAGHAVNNGWFYFLDGSDEVRLLFPLAAVVALATLVLRRYSIEYSRYTLAFAVGVEAAARIVRRIQDAPPPDHPVGPYMALALLIPVLMLAGDASLLAGLGRRPAKAQEPAG
jgi:hypothetical protein